MGDKFIALLDFAVRNLGELKSCGLYGELSGSIDVQTKEGKLINIYITTKEENTNA